MDAKPASMLPPPAPSSDPIDEFSSPQVPGEPAAAVQRPQRPQRAQVQPLPLLDTLKHADDSDDELPELAVVIEEDRRRAKLKQIKEQALRQRSKPTVPDSDDDDLVVVGNAQDNQALKGTAAKGPTRNQQTLNSLGVRQSRPAGAGQRPSNKKDLDRALLERAHAQSAALAKSKEEAFLKQGGRLVIAETTEASETPLEVLLEQGRLAAQNQSANDGMDVDDEEDENDGDYVPEGQKSPASVHSADEGVPSDDEVDADVTMVNDEDEENIVPVRSRRRHVVSVDSDEEDSPAVGCLL